MGTMGKGAPDLIGLLQREKSEGNCLSDLEKIRQYYGAQTVFILGSDSKERITLQEYCCLDGLRIPAYPDSAGSAEALEELFEVIGKSSFATLKRGELPHGIVEELLCDEFVMTPFKDEKGSVKGIVSVGFCEGGTPREARLTELAEDIEIIALFASVRRLLRGYVAAEQLEDMLDNLGIDLYVNDYYTGEILYVNSSMAAPYGEKEDLLGKHCWQMLYENQTGPCDFCKRDCLLDEDGNPTKTYKWEYKRPFDGSWFQVYVAAFPWVDGRIAQAISSVDITDAKRNELLVEHIAYYDALTNVQNRRKFQKDFQEILGSGSKGYLFFIDLDNFKRINDMFGHESGDKLLIKIADYLNGFALCEGRVYRLGGDEFVLLVGGIDENDAVEFAERIVDQCRAPWDIGGKELFCTVSVGLSAYFGDGSESYDELLSSADYAMYEAKRNGKSGVSLYRSGVTERSGDLETEFALRRTIARGCNEFFLLFNPLMNAADGECVGAEVLLRWNSPEYGVLLPQAFLGALIRLNLMVEVSRWLLREGVRLVSEAGLFDKKDFCLSFNVTKAEVSDSGFAGFLESIVEEYGVEPGAIMLEIAESVAEMGTISEEIAELMQRGFIVSIDGFASRYSDVTAIKSIKVNMVKVSKDRVIGCLKDEFSRVLVRTIPMMAHAAETRICAEGVETQEIEEYLRDCGYDFLQGIYYSKPLRGEALRGLRDRN